MSSHDSEIKKGFYMKENDLKTKITRTMSTSTLVKLKKVGNSQAVIIPSNFLKGVDKTHEVIMNIEDNEIRLVFAESRSLQDLIDEKRARNRGLLAKVAKQIEKIDPNKFENDYIIYGADELID